ncbi:hypothetical protein LENED_005261 [Lentinula edodes]|uniref:Uncharacterized protein n=1 Tax=Lentinula edodes TaxID=5353 RepID=A0A1Q3E8V2_LENED|nr:hypothetical protein LENED_005261 [Lentinula edodes]
MPSLDQTRFWSEVDALFLVTVPLLLCNLTDLGFHVENKTPTNLSVEPELGLNFAVHCVQSKCNTRSLISMLQFWGLDTTVHYDCVSDQFSSSIITLLNTPFHGWRRHNRKKMFIDKVVVLRCSQQLVKPKLFAQHHQNTEQK